ncbi:MAG TPA: alpha/beta hydrolase, partial [Usitatibacter sp.]|nr:alpha/beta hydrolase [Usitatibacter sp.]
IGQYVGRDPDFESIDALEAAMRSVSPFGDLTAEQWRHLSLNVARHDPDGRWRFRSDPGIAKVFHAAPPAEVDLRRFWANVHGPVLVIRGENSDLLLPETLDEMCRRPHTERLVVARTGHAPMLMDDSQVAAVRRFLLR